MSTPLRYARIDSPLGELTAARSSAGLCALVFSDESPDGGLAAVRDRLSVRFPDLTWAESPQAFDDLRDWLGRYFGRLAVSPDDSSSPLIAPLGTPFQLQVWQTLQSIQAGQFITYTELARRVGRPRAIRAAAGACAANPLALIVPCHRVIARSGEPGGYRWGIWRKRQLLALESERRSAITA